MIIKHYTRSREISQLKFTVLHIHSIYVHTSSGDCTETTLKPTEATWNHAQMQFKCSSNAAHIMQY